MRRATLVLPLLAALCFTTCGGDKETRTAHIDGLSFDSIVVDSSAALTESGTPRCHVRLSLQYAKGEQAERLNNTLAHASVLTPDYFSIGGETLTLQQAADSFVRRYLSEYLEDYAPLFRADREHAKSYECEYLVSTRTQEGPEGILNYIASVYLYGGGEHAVRQTLAKNIDTRSGALITTDSLFVPGYQQTLQDLIVKELCRQKDVDDLSALQAAGIFIDGQVYVPENFILGKDDVTFIYCEDEIARHEEGEIRVALTHKKLKDIIKKWN